MAWGKHYFEVRNESNARDVLIPFQSVKFIEFSLNGDMPRTMHVVCFGKPSLSIEVYETKEIKSQLERWLEWVGGK